MKILFSIAFVLLSMMSFGQAGQYGKFLPGVIYDNFGHKYVGYVAFAGKSSTGRKPAHFQNAANNVILFKNDSLSEAKLIDTHIVRGFKIASDSFTILREGINEFMPQMSAYLKDNEQIVARIKNREYSYFKIEQLVRDYNALSKQIQ